MAIVCVGYRQPSDCYCLHGSIIHSLFMNGQDRDAVVYMAGDGSAEMAGALCFMVQ